MQHPMRHVRLYGQSFPIPVDPRVIEGLPVPEIARMLAYAIHELADLRERLDRSGLAPEVKITVG